MSDYKVKTAVLLIFFIRSDTFSQVFEAVRKVKPQKLYLSQDGPRDDHPDDMKKILEVRKIAESIDWPCTVERFYRTENMGCDPSEFESISWAFNNEEKLIILEDDDVPSVSFFRYCDELLERYESDNRVFMICGRNQVGNIKHRERYYDETNSYFFAQSDAIWGWAIWKNRWALCDPKHNYLLSDAAKQYVIKNAPTRFAGECFIEKCQKHRKETIEKGKVASYESPIKAALYLHNMVSIVPKENLIKNVGITGDSVHSEANLKHVPKGMQSIYYLDANELEFPLKHPEYILNNRAFSLKRAKILAADSKWRRVFRMFEVAFRKRVFR